MNKIKTDTEVINYILNSPEIYSFWFGAGTSAEAGVLTGQSICEALRTEMLKTLPAADLANEEKVNAWANKHLDWDKPERRYVTCILKGRPNLVLRVNYFRGLLRGIQPSFAHHAVALLMSKNYVQRTCLTTNFDYLIESAFMLQGISGCQPLRKDEERVYWDPKLKDRYFVVKLHGDVDTLNILNTREETINISNTMFDLVKQVTHGAGLVVLGTAGNEKSVRNVFDELRETAGGVNASLSYGLLWGVYMGPVRPKNISDDELKRQVEERIKVTGIHSDIVDVIEDSNNDLFSFFPMWGAGNFMHDLIRATGNRDIISAAEQYLDHKMRLRQVFTRAGLTEEAIEKHIAALDGQQKKIAAARSMGTGVANAETVFKARGQNMPVEVRVIYGDITSRTQMDSEEFKSVRRAVVSPEDTCVSAGGGVAYVLLDKANPRIILNELAKFSPIEHDTVAVTSAGKLPVHYIIHAAAIEIDKDANYKITQGDVFKTMTNVLRTASALGIGALWVPLMGAGVGPLGPRPSLESILEAIAVWDNKSQQTTIMIVIYKEGELPRNIVHECLNEKLNALFSIEPV